MEADREARFPPAAAVLEAVQEADGIRAGACGAVREVSRARRIRKWIVEYRVVRCGPAGERREEWVLGKSYADDRGAVAFRLMRHLWRNGLGAGSRHTIARPIAYLEPWRFLLMSRAPGTTLAAHLQDPHHASRPAAEAAAWLARLHGVPLPDPPPVGDPAREAGAGRFIRELMAAVPPQGDRIAALGRQIADEGAVPSSHAPPSSRAVLLHGDFHPRNVFIDGDRVTAIDFDQCTTGDPARDVAYLIAQIQVDAFFRSGDFHRHDAPARAALATYLGRRPPPEPDAFLARVARWRTRWILESLHYELCVLRTRRPEIAPAFLGEAERAAAGEIFA